MASAAAGYGMVLNPGFHGQRTPTQVPIRLILGRDQQKLEQKKLYSQSRTVKVLFKTRASVLSDESGASVCSCTTCHGTSYRIKEGMHHSRLVYSHGFVIAAGCVYDSLADPRAEEETIGVKVAITFLNFYKREISPWLPGSCRFVPTCSEYSMQAYRRYGVLKGTILTAWRLLRCNPLGPSGFDPPRWFGEDK